jgi:putative hydrolase of the HAD superfamily
MIKKALIIDLDNTIFPVSSLSGDLFLPVLSLIEKSGEFEGDFSKVKQDILRRPFQRVAGDYNFSRNLITEGISLLSTAVCNRRITLYDDYEELRKIKCRKYLVTSGFMKMQQSKIDMLGIANDFEEIHIIDPLISQLTKKDVFADILERHTLKKSEVLIIGDDSDSEIKAARELGIDSILYNRSGNNETASINASISHFSQLADLLRLQKH